MPKCSFPECKVKVPLTATPCHCSHIYCPKHRFYTDHACSFDYAKQNKDYLLKLMSTPIIASKLERV